MSVNIVNSDGSTSKIAGGIPSDDLEIIKGDLAGVESTSIASKAYAQGDIFVMSTGQLVRAISAIAQGDTITLNTNVLVTSIAELLDEKADITDLDDKVDKVTGGTNGNLAKLDANGNLADGGWASDKTTTSATGNPISISGLKSNQLAVNPIITLEPIQAGSGTSSPSNIRAISGYDKIEVLSCGKNLINCLAGNSTPSDTTSSNATKRTFVPNTWVVGLSYNNYYYPTNVTNVSKLEGGISGTSAGIYGVGYVLKLKKGATYSLSYTVGSNTNIRTIYYGKDGTWLGQYVNDTFTVGNETEYVVIVIYANSNDFSVTNLQLEENTESTAYVSYDKTTDLSESLGQTVYGASHDVRAGKLTNQLGLYTMETKTAFNQSGTHKYVLYYPTGIKSVSGATDDCVFERLPFVSGIGDYFGYYHGTNMIVVCVPDNYTIEEFNANIAGSKFTYPLATPTEIQLTPHEISLLKNYAYVSTNGTSITFDYHNGEMASLADVSQLGETVNELGEELDERCPKEVFAEYSPSNVAHSYIINDTGLFLVFANSYSTDNTNVVYVGIMVVATGWVSLYDIKPASNIQISLDSSNRTLTLEATPYGQLTVIKV